MQLVPRSQVLTLVLCLMLGGSVAAQQPTPETKPEAKQAESQPEQKPEEKPSEQKPEEDKAAEQKTAEQKPEADIVPAQEKKPTGPPTTKTLAAPEQIIPAEALLAPPPPPKGKIALTGGTVKSIDQIRNRMELQVHGGGKMKMFFDERSHFYRDGVETTQLGVKKGDRIYVDSQLDQGKIFARNVHVQSDRPVASASGQVLSYNPRNGELSLAEPISARPVLFRVTSNTLFRRGDQPGSAADLRHNAIVKVSFQPAPGKRAEVREVELVAVPGTKFTFWGTLTHLDLRSGLLAVENRADSRLYEIRFRPGTQTVTEDLVVGAEVSVVATFTGRDYAAESLQITRRKGEQSQTQ